MAIKYRKMMGTALNTCRYLRMATVMASGEEAHGQIISGFRPWDWNTFRKASQDDTDPKTEIWIIYLHLKPLKHRNTAISFPYLVSLQGLAPSATISMRREERVVSFWSLWAIIAQCKSLHFTKAIRAVCKHKHERTLDTVQQNCWFNMIAIIQITIT